MVQPEPLGEGKGAVQWGLTLLFGLGLREDNSGFILGRKTEREMERKEREREKRLVESCRDRVSGSGLGLRL